MNDQYRIDLVMLVPGNDEKETFEGLLSSRCKSLGMREVNYEILAHHRRDPGCFHEAPEFLQTYRRYAKYGMVVFDYKGPDRKTAVLKRSSMI